MALFSIIFTVNFAYIIIIDLNLNCFLFDWKIIINIEKTYIYRELTWIEHNLNATPLTIKKMRGDKNELLLY